MTQAGPALTPLPADATIPEGTLRADMENRRAQGERYSLREVVAIIVPLCTDLTARHENGESFLVTPSCIRFEVGSPTGLIPNQAPAKLPRDRACVAPEGRSGKGGDARSTVFSIGAIIYEMLTGEAVGPGMRRPTEIATDLPAIVDTILSKALIGDPAHRPADLGALAQAIHNLAPTASQAPPPADLSGLDGDDDFEVDISLSMMPPAPKAATGAALPPPAAIPSDLMGGDDSGDLVAVAEAPKGPALIDPTSALAELRHRLESDPRPRYVVIKDGMDHGPFSSVELLQQIASHTFLAEHILVDTFSQDERPIADWEEFAPFAEHARLNKQIVAEKQELERSVVAETKTTRTKALFIGGALVAVAALGVGGWFIAKPKSRSGQVVIDDQSALSIDFDGGIKSSATGPKAGGKWSRSTGSDGVSRPVLVGGMSCEQAMNTYVTELKMAGNKPDLTNGQLGAALNNGGYVVGCGAPFSMTVSICAAIQNGRAVGVTVVTDPKSPDVASCIASRVRSMSFPSHPALDVTRTVFRGE
ncbi:MAG: hypothetical protein ACOC1F_03490 [Myxococcota bacterium]